MKKLLAVFVGLLATVLIATAALATSPHFIGTPTLSTSGSTATVSFKAAGLGNVSSATFTLSGSATVSARCYTKSGNKPQAANKQETRALSTTSTLPVTTGQTTGSLTLTAPASTLVCPNGQKVVTESVTFSSLTLSGQGLSYSF
jgi:hypothetical protein